MSPAEMTSANGEGIANWEPNADMAAQEVYGVVRRRSDDDRLYP